MRGISFVPQQDVSTFGNEKLGVILNHYGEPKTFKDDDAGTETISSPVIDRKAAEEEWKLLKQIMRDSSSYTPDNISTLWQYLNASHGKELQNLVKLAKVALVFPFQTATRERGFSVQNCTKTITWNIQEGNLRALMNVNINGPPYQQVQLPISIGYLEVSKEQENLCFKVTCK